MALDIVVVDEIVGRTVVEEDGLLVAGILGYTINRGGRSVVAEVYQGWGLLMSPNSNIRY